MSRPAAHTASPGRRPFLSLKWKAVLLLSLILATVNLTLVSLNVVRLQEQFEHHRHSLSERQTLQFEALVEHSFSNLERLAPLLVESGNGEPSPILLRDRLADRLDNRAAALEIDWDITALVFMDHGGRVRYRQGMARIPAALLQIMHGARKSETARRILLCLEECRQYVAVPVLDRDRLAGILLLGRTIADAVSSFRQITGSDLAVLTATPLSTPSGSGPGRIGLPAWNRWLALASSSEHLVPLLQALSAEAGLARIGERDPYRYRHGDRTYDLLRIPGGHLPWRGFDDFLVISDITPEVEYIQAAHRQSMAVGLAGFAMSELLLLLLLGTPMNRLKRLASMLPRLAEGRTRQVKSELAAPPRKGFEDEIDIADHATAALAERLEELNREVEERTRSLVERSEALTRERDFVAGLLKSAQVAILTLDTRGRIRSINPEGERITGRDESTVGREHFLDLLEQDSRSEELARALHMLARGELHSYQHESHLRSLDGKLRTISWVHSRLSGSASDRDAVILSVGLDTTKRKEAETSLAWLADHDPLTELINRRRFQQEFQGILSLTLRYRHEGALLFFDLDQFKYVNDTSGHQAGDVMLKLVAGALRRIVRESDLLARLGGDEFALVMPETDAAGATRMANRILDGLSRIELPTHGHVHRISASIGIALFPAHGNRVEDLMAHADLAMYQAKEVGRGCWHLFSWDEQKRKQLNEEVYWKQQIELALQEERFFLDFQPIIEIGTRRISHYEVLIRMRERDGSVALPGKFIPVAERTGLIHRIDHLVLTRAVEVLASRPHSDFTLSINLSGKVVDEQEFLPLLRRLLEQSGIDPHRLLIEITETAALADIPAAAQLMSSVRALGCRTALDDFGAGFSSFFYLRELSLDMVKIDGSFIRNLPRSSEDRIFVRAITEVARGLGKQTIAEFVEDEETLQMLHELRVDYAQGYHIGRPGPLPEDAGS